MIDRLDPRQNGERTKLDRIERAIEEKLESGEGAPFAIFDFDNTCIVNDIAEASLAYLCGHELLRDKELLGGSHGGAAEYHARVFRTYHALLEKGAMLPLCILCARIFSGYTPGEAEALVLATITEEGSKLGSKMLYDVHIERGLAVRREAMELMRFMRDRGVRPWIVSAAPEPAVRTAMKHFGIEADLIAAKSVLRDGVFTQELEQPTPFTDGKVECVRKFIDPSRAPLFVAGDSVGDIPMLEMGEIQVAVARGEEFGNMARERGWFLL